MSFDSDLTTARNALVGAINEIVRDNFTDDMLDKKFLITSFMDHGGWTFGGDEETTNLNEYIAFYANGKPLESLDNIPLYKHREAVILHIEEALIDICHAYMGDNAPPPPPEVHDEALWYMGDNAPPLPPKGHDEALQYIIASYNVYIESKTSLTKAAR
jgi:hypothetical protein